MQCISFTFSSNDIFVLEKVRFVNFTDDNKLYDVGQDLSDITENLKHDTKICDPGYMMKMVSNKLFTS